MNKEMMFHDFSMLNFTYEFNAKRFNNEFLLNLRKIAVVLKNTFNFKSDELAKCLDN